MAAQADAYRARAAGHDRKAETLGGGNAAIRAYYQRLANHWRSLALLTEVKTEREQSDTTAASRREHGTSDSQRGEVG
jgi:hypothetical protein